MSKLHYDIQLLGKVQGVGFRYRAKEYADSIGIKGYARNMRDGSVSLEIEGEEEDLKAFLDWCNSDNNRARIENITSQTSPIKGYREFQIY